MCFLRTGVHLRSVSLILVICIYTQLQFAGAHERHAMAMQELDWPAENITRSFPR